MIDLRPNAILIRYIEQIPKMKIHLRIAQTLADKLDVILFSDRLVSERDTNRECIIITPQLLMVYVPDD